MIGSEKRTRTCSLNLYNVSGWHILSDVGRIAMQLRDHRLELVQAFGGVRVLVADQLTVEVNGEENENHADRYEQNGADHCRVPAFIAQIPEFHLFEI